MSTPYLGLKFQNRTLGSKVSNILGKCLKWAVLIENVAFLVEILKLGYLVVIVLVTAKFRTIRLLTTKIPHLWTKNPEKWNDSIENVPFKSNVQKLVHLGRI